MPKIAFSMAAYGPLQSGGNVRLLARPSDHALSPQAESQLSDIYFAGWRLAETRDDSYWAFLPLDGRHWGLFRGELIARRSGGVIFVMWLALFEHAALEKIAWQTPKLWQLAFPNARTLPDPNTVYPPRIVAFEFTPQPQPASRYDAMAFETERQWSLEAKVALITSTPEQSLAEMWSRLGNWAANRSYCSWDGIDQLGYKPLAGPFDVIAARQPFDPARAVVLGEAQPPIAWYVSREHLAGVARPIGLAMNVPDDVPDTAVILFETSRSRLVDAHDFDVFKEWLTDGGDIVLALPTILDLLVGAFLTQGDRSSAASAIDWFVITILPHLDAHPKMPAHSQSVAILAVRQKLITLLAPHTIDVFAPLIFGSSDASAMVRQVENEVTALAVDARHEEHPALLHLSTLLAGRRGFDELRDAIAAALWSREAHLAPSEVIKDRLIAAGDWLLIPTRLDALARRVPTRLRHRFLADHLGFAADEIRRGSREQPDEHVTSIGGLLRLWEIGSNDGWQAEEEAM